MVRVLLLVLLCGYAHAGHDTSLENDIELYLARMESWDDKASPAASFKDGVVFRTPDGKSMLRMRARMLMDFYGASTDDFEAPLTDDGVFMRQARLGVVGYAHEKLLYMLEYEFRNGEARAFDIFLGLDDIGPLGRVIVGHQREPWGLDGTTPLPFLVFLERASSSRAFALGRNVGIRFQEMYAEGRMTWWAGIFRDTDRFARPSGEGGYALTAKITGLPFRTRKQRMLHTELSVTLRDPPDGITRFRARHGPATGPQLVDTGFIEATRDARASFATVLRVDSFVVQAEGYVAHVSGAGTDATFWGAYVQVSYWITGEVPRWSNRHAVWGRVVPRRMFHDGTGGMGAWMIALRYDHLDLADGGIEGGVLDSVTLGVTWLWNPNTRIKIDFAYADAEDGPKGSGNIFNVTMRFQWDF